MAKLDNSVDYYYLANRVHSTESTAGFDYRRSSKSLGIHLLTKDECPEMFKYFRQLSVRMYLLRILDYDKRPFVNKLLLKYCLYKIKKQKYDVINVVGQYSWSSFIHEELRDQNLIHTFHEIGNHEGALKPLPVVELAVRDNNKVILHSQALYEKYLQLPKVDKSKVTYIPFGKFETCLLYFHKVDLHLPFNPQKPILLFYGFLLPYKGLDILAEAHCLLSDLHDKFNMIIAGNGSDPNLTYFRNQSNCYVINKFIPDNELMNIIQLSSVVLLPYRSASQTGIIPTCTLYGKPFIATSVGAFSESVKNDYNGLLVPKNNSNAFANAIRRVLLEDGLLNKLGSGAANFGNGDEYDWNIIAHKTHQFFSF